MNFLIKRTIALIAFIGTLFFTLNLYAQKEKPLARVNVKKQTAYGKLLKNKIESERAHAHKLAATKGWKITQTFKDGRIRNLVAVDDFGLPIYEESDNNTIAAATTNTNKLYTGGSLGLDLNGSTLPAGAVAVFESGSPLLTHQEFGGRVTLKTAGTTSSHATHVSGTIMAAGVNPIAKGMAYALPQLWAFIATTTSMNNFSGEMLVSNHSYGTVAGWDKDDDGKWRYYGRYGSTEDYRFGYYDSNAQQWDNICFNAPYYLPLKSSGNFRTRTGPAIGEDYWGYPSSGGAMVNLGPRPAAISSNNSYGIITTYGNAKNNLTVGAINGLPNGSNHPQDISIATFSSWGPTDDGRIKPDLVADGVSITSTNHTSNTAYISSSGTSMSTPNATGTLALLQELYHQKYAAFMRSATLKALVLATTSPTGTSLGPNYIFGWGLLNAEKAAKAILENGATSSIQEKSLSPNQTETIQVVANGKAPLIATICWTDPPAIPVSNNDALNNPILRLVNDLDIRGEDGTKTHYPWILDPANPSVPATKGDNFRDNVEQVYIENPVPGKTYTFSISHKNGLKDNLAQAYSVIITGVGGTNYCASNANETTGAKITNFKLANLDYSPSATNAPYLDLTANTVEVIEDLSYPLSISTAAFGTSAPAIAKVYVDWNNDGDFDDADELLTTSSVIPVNDTYNATITIPANLAANASSIMRVVLVETNHQNDVQACGAYTKGTTHDYSIKFLKQVSTNLQRAITGYGNAKVFVKNVAVTTQTATTGVNVQNPNQYGTLNLVAGNGIFGSADVPYPVSASFANPLNVEFDDNGNMFVAENGSPGKIRAMRASDNAVITIDNAVPNNNFTFTGINGLAIYGQKIYVVSESSNTIKYANIPADISTPFNFNSIALPAGFGNSISDLAVDSTSLVENPTFYIIDTKTNIKRVALNLVTNTATLLTDITIPTPNPTLSGVNQFKVMANKDIYVPNRNRQVLLKYTFNPSNNTYSISTLAGTASAARPITDNFIYNSPLLNGPIDLVVGEQNKVYFTEYGGTRIRVYDPNSPDMVLTVIGQNTGAPTEDYTVGYAARGDGHFGMVIKNGYIYFAQRNNRRIAKVDISSGKFPYTIAPALPTGLVFNNYNGEITGTPTSNTPLTTYTVTTYNNNGDAVATATIDIEVANVLPVTLKNFNAKKQTNGSVNITWATSSEVNNSYFIVEKSTNGINYTLLTQQKTAGEQGGNYSFTDTNPHGGTNYYKLLQVDKDGQTEELGVKAVNIGLKDNDWSLYPNPSNGTSIKIQCLTETPTTKQVKIYNLTGALVYSQQLLLTAETTINLKNQLASGMYIVSIENLGTKKLIVQ
ncbi:S8 family serine peptidase [Pedobacter sp. UBA4863]|uniref:S8 family serine peptidase n=1 Tax=Pedobacter sp. UBA4863 TaxID=1947060 RepID=UPI0025F6E519|nr:S8 family serine peptidase [Pedobacter sp. UBA4863]